MRVTLTITIAATTIEIAINKKAVGVEVVGFCLGVPTEKMDAVKADAGTVPDTVSGAVNVVATETHVSPFQYSITLARVKPGFDMATVTEMSEPKDPLLEETSTS